MDDTALATFSGISQGIEKAVANIQNINMMKYKLSQEKELFNIQKKKGQLEIQEAEFKLSPDQIEATKNLNTSKVRVAEALFNLRERQLLAEESKQRRELSEHEKAMAMVDRALAGGMSSFLKPGERISVGGASLGRATEKGSMPEFSLPYNSRQNLAPVATAGADTEVDSFLEQF